MAQSQPKRREEDIFSVARVISTEEGRRKYLDQMCAADPETRREVEDLLAVYDREQSFLESPPPELDRTTDSNGGSPRGKPLENPREAPGMMIGPYKILELIGEGGMGNVYMAEQIEPVHRKVALKVIKSGMDSRLVIARFEAERQALALMDHPSIAKFFDAGISDSGSPYFVMELIKGRPIVEYCRQHNLDLKAKLELFSQVCHGVQHAHQKGIIHRDIKPSNVLVARYDDRPVAKVIDFGVAKATGEKLTDKTMFTRFGQLVGSLEYMSPERAATSTPWARFCTDC
jgi:serine/threonine protein kinase